MSLTSFVARPEVLARIKPLRPKGPRRISIPLRVPPQGKRYALVGTAFDYLLRFEFPRRAPHATVRPWLAEVVPRLMLKNPVPIAIDLKLDLSLSPESREIIGRTVIDVAQRAHRVVENAKRDVAAFQKRRDVPDGDAIATLAGHAFRLAKLDGYYRAGRFDPTFEDAPAEDVENLVNLLTLVPFDQLTHPEVLILNPTFGEASQDVGGADGDLIAGDMLVDIKTVKEATVDSTTLDQLLGYLLLARRHRQKEQAFPEIKRVGVYFSRHGHLWTAPATDWTLHPDFAELERWFFERAGQVSVPPAVRVGLVRPPV
jgi:hypothetical protein